MQHYGKVFAQVYDVQWSYFTTAYGPVILEFYKQIQNDKKNYWVLDLCCGTGQLLKIFLKAGYQAIGIDKSKYMLEEAQDKTKEFQKNVRFYNQDAMDFKILEKVNLVTSMFDSLNHLNNLEELGRCFESVFQCLVPGGFFIFDLNTRKGLIPWATLSVQHEADYTIINQGIFTPDMDRAYTQVTGFVKNKNGTYSKFDEVFFNTHFPIKEVEVLLYKTGFSRVSLRNGSFSQETETPEEEPRIFFICQK